MNVAVQARGNLALVVVVLACSHAEAGETGDEGLGRRLTTPWLGRVLVVFDRAEQRQQQDAEEAPGRVAAGLRRGDGDSGGAAATCWSWGLHGGLLFTMKRETEGVR